MSIFRNHFPLGLGTNRFLVSGPKDIKGIENSIELVCHALESGVTYADVGFHYSAGMTPMILKEAFQRTGKNFQLLRKLCMTRIKQQMMHANE
ncbi:MAG: hypothetical protein HFE76_16905 [Firmicutes bacterium]|nr:hypothetical protein [Bacillota bacterium]